MLARWTPGPTILVELVLVFDGGVNGVANNPILITTPTTQSGGGQLPLHPSFAYILDNGVAWYPCSVQMTNSTQVNFLRDDFGFTVGSVGADPNFGLAVNDQIYAGFTYVPA
jgi:hypothetical protein